jgi:hypothetical protein
VSTVRAILKGIVWVVIAVAISLGGAGVVASTHYVPGTPARAELTWAGDSAATPALDGATTRLQALSNEVDSLGSTAREALAAVVAGDVDLVNQTIAAGTLQLGTVLDATSGLEQAVAAVPGVGDDSDLRLSPEVQQRYEHLATTPSITDGLKADWTLFTGRALDASNLHSLLTRHDQETAAAAKQGSVGKYQTALDLLDVSDATIAETRAVRDRLANTTDVSTLTTWLDRNAAYDAALRTLYQALQDAHGTVTDAVREAFAGEQAARKNLPVDTRGLIVIMADVAQAGLNQAVISIEEARGRLSAALDLQQNLEQELAPPE